jgi:hypothetical protein
MKSLIVFMTKSGEVGNLYYELKNEINLTKIKEKIKKEWGHEPKETIILNIIR